MFEAAYRDQWIQTSPMAKMSVLKSWIVCMIFLMDYTRTVTSEHSENLNNNNDTLSNGTYWQSIAKCLNKPSKLLTHCVFKRSLHRLDEVISSNQTWQLNGYVSLRKNEDWKPIVLGRAMQTPYGQILSRVNDLLTSRSLQFTIPTIDDGEQREGRYYGGNGGSSIAMGMSLVAIKFCNLFI